MVVVLGVVVVVVVVEGGGVFIMGHMWVRGGEGGGLPWRWWWPWVSGVAVGWWRGGRGWGFYYGSCGFMVVKVGGCRGDGGGHGFWV